MKKMGIQQAWSNFAGDSTRTNCSLGPGADGSKWFDIWASQDGTRLTMSRYFFMGSLKSARHHICSLSLRFCARTSFCRSTDLHSPLKVTPPCSPNDRKPNFAAVSQHWILWHGQFFSHWSLRQYFRARTASPQKLQRITFSPWLEQRVCILSKHHHIPRWNEHFSNKKPRQFTRIPRIFEGFFMFCYLPTSTNCCIRRLAMAIYSWSSLWVQKIRQFNWGINLSMGWFTDDFDEWLDLLGSWGNPYFVHAKL